MIISSKRILELNEKYHLVSNLSERESLNPEGVGFDLRVGEIYKLKGDAFLGVTDRETPKEDLVASAERGDKEYVLKPGDYVLVKTMESVHLPAEKIIVGKEHQPAHIMMRVHPRSTLHRCGILFLATKTDPGYSGQLVYALSNVGNVNFRIELGARFANMVFEMVTGDLARPYEGQWKDGRVSTGGKEKQN